MLTIESRRTSNFGAAQLRHRASHTVTTVLVSWLTEPHHPLELASTIRTDPLSHLPCSPLSHGFLRTSVHRYLLHRHHTPSYHTGDTGSLSHTTTSSQLLRSVLTHSAIAAHLPCSPLSHGLLGAPVHRYLIDICIIAIAHLLIVLFPFTSATRRLDEPLHVFVLYVASHSVSDPHLGLQSSQSLQFYLCLNVAQLFALMP